MGKSVTNRKQSNVLLKWIRHVLRTRVVSLSLVILPQICGLATLGCLFYFLRIQEQFIVPARADYGNARPLLHCFLMPGQVAKISKRVPIQVDLLNGDDRTLVSGKGMVRSLSFTAGRYVMDVQDPGVSAVIRKANGMESPRVRITTRARRGVDILMERGGSVR